MLARPALSPDTCKGPSTNNGEEGRSISRSTFFSTIGNSPAMVKGLLIVVMLALVLIPLLMIPGHGFYNDDFRWIERARLALSNPARIFIPWTQWFVRPVPQALFLVELLLFGTKPLGYNILSILLHIGAGVLVWRLAFRVGLGRFGGAICAIFFLAGIGHHMKPVAWACSQSVMIGTILALAAALTLLRSPGSERVRSSAPFPILPLVLASLAMLSHETVAAAPLAISLLIWCRRHPRRKSFTAASIVIVAACFLATFRPHSEFTAMKSYGLGTHVIFNMIRYLGSLTGPLHSAQITERVVGRLNIHNWLVTTAPSVVIIAGAAAVLVLLFFPRERKRIEWGLVGAGFFFLLPPLFFTFKPGWVNARYLYPTPAFFLPVLGLTVIRLAGQFRWRKIMLALILSIVFLGAIGGSVYQVRKAIRQGRSAEQSRYNDHEVPVHMVQETY